MLAALLAGLILGAISFVHCLGMCGGFALHLSRPGPAGQSRFGTVLGRQLLWHGGRITTYVFLGALAGLLGHMVESLRQPWVQFTFRHVMAAMLVLMGLTLLGVRPRRRKLTHSEPSTEREHADAFGDKPNSSAESAEPGLLTAIFRGFFVQPTPAAAISLGLANGFLPCPITFFGLGIAATTQSVLGGMLTMLGMGLGTIWSLLLLGLTGQYLGGRFRRWAGPVEGALMIVLGIGLTIRLPGTIERLIKGG